MKDCNQVFLQGAIGDDYKYKKTQDGKDFATFTLLVSTKFHGADAQSMIRIMVFDQNLVQYLRKVEAHQGNRCSIVGSITSYSREIKGQNTIQNNVYVKDIVIMKTQPNPKK